MTRSAFARIPVSDSTHSQYLERETTELREMLQRARGGDGLTVKRLEKMVLTAEQRVQGLLDHPVDPGISFEETGDRLSARRRGPLREKPADRLKHPRRIDRGIKTRERPAHEARVSPQPPRSARRDARDRNPDREQHHRSARDATLPPARPPTRRRRRGLRRVGGNVRRARHRDRDGTHRRRVLSNAHPLRQVHQRPRNPKALARLRGRPHHRRSQSGDPADRRPRRRETRRRNNRYRQPPRTFARTSSSSATGRSRSAPAP